MASEQITTRELDDDRHQRLLWREWIAERCGMSLMALVLLAAFLGFLGPGLLSHRTSVSTEGQATVQYEAVERYEAPARLVIYLTEPQGKGQGIVLGISRSFTDRVTVENITPEPEVTEMAEDRVVYHFRTAPVVSEGRIIFRYKHDEFGPLSFVIDLPDGGSADVAQLVLP